MADTQQQDAVAVIRARLTTVEGYNEAIRTLDSNPCRDDDEDGELTVLRVQRGHVLRAHYANDVRTLLDRLDRAERERATGIAAICQHIRECDQRIDNSAELLAELRAEGVDDPVMRASAQREITFRDGLARALEHMTFAAAQS